MSYTTIPYIVALPPRTPKRQTADPKSFVDMSLVQELEASGFHQPLNKG